MGIFSAEDVAGLWHESEQLQEKYSLPAPTDEMIAKVEAALGYTLPAAYIELARTSRNGGYLERDAYPSDAGMWAEDHVAATTLFAIGEEGSYSLLGDLGSQFWMDEWGYPPVGVYFADTPTAGHTMFVLDYRECGPHGEPSVAEVDQEGDYRIEQIAPDFATFIRGLVPMDDFEEPEEEVEARYLAIVNEGTFSPVILRALDALSDEAPFLGSAIRRIGRDIVKEKGHFSLHADGNSHLMYQTMFLLYSALTTARSRDDFIFRSDGQTDYSRPCYELMIPTSFVADPYSFTTGGWAPAFVTDWWNEAVDSGQIVETPEGFRLDPDVEKGLLRVLKALS